MCPVTMKGVWHPYIVIDTMGEDVMAAYIASADWKWRRDKM